MIGLAVQVVRVCAGILKLIARLLGIAVRWGMAATRRPSTTPHETDAGPTARHDPTTPSRRRAFTAPRRARRTVA